MDKYIDSYGYNNIFDFLLKINLTLCFLEFLFFRNKNDFKTKCFDYISNDNL